MLYLKADEVKLAHDCFCRAQSSDPSYQPAWACEARVAEIIGEIPEAVDMYRHATELEYSVCLLYFMLLVCVCFVYCFGKMFVCLFVCLY